MHDDSIVLNYYGDDYLSHYMLAGERFEPQKALLELIAQYGGACTEDQKRYADVQPDICDFDCLHCQKSIYHLMALKEKFMQTRCEELCSHHPRKDDEWEVSIYSQTDHPHYEEFFFKALKNIDMSIIELSYESMKEIRPEFLEIAKYCYVKIRRSDMTQALDVSTVANKRYHQLEES